MYSRPRSRSRLGDVLAPADPATQSYIATLQNGSTVTVPPGVALPPTTVSFTRGSIVPVGSSFPVPQPSTLALPAPTSTVAAEATATASPAAATTDYSSYYLLAGVGLALYLFLRQ